MLITNPIGSLPTTWTVTDLKGASSLAWSPKQSGSPGSASSSSVAGSASSYSTEGAVVEALPDAVSVEQSLMEALADMRSVLGAGRPNASSPSRTAADHTATARLEATIARYFQH